jgi:hypothetical protein
MDPTLRGWIEKFIDEGLKPERLKNIYQGLSDLLSLAKSKGRYATRLLESSSRGS